MSELESYECTLCDKKSSELWEKLRAAGWYYGRVDPGDKMILCPKCAKKHVYTAGIAGRAHSLLNWVMMKWQRAAAHKFNRLIGAFIGEVKHE